MRLDRRRDSGNVGGAGVSRAGADILAFPLFNTHDFTGGVTVMQRMACSSIIILALAGCGGGPTAQDAGPELPTWEGLKALNQESIMKPLMMPTQIEKPDGGRQPVERP